MRQRFTAAAGVSLRGIGLQTGRAAGIEIDNASGSWLYIPTLETWVPPYVVGWAQAFPYGVASCDVVAGDGPAGQIGTAQGDGITVYLTDQSVASSPGEVKTGAPFIEQFTQTLARQGSEYVAVLLGFAGGILAPVAGKRYRLWTFATALEPDPGMDARLVWNVTDWDGAALFSGGALGGFLSPDMPFNGPFVFSGGLDFPVGGGVGLMSRALFIDGYISYSVTYQLI